MTTPDPAAVRATLEWLRDRYRGKTASAWEQLAPDQAGADRIFAAEMTDNWDTYVRICAALGEQPLQPATLEDDDGG